MEMLLKKQVIVMIKSKRKTYYNYDEFCKIMKQ